MKRFLAPLLFAVVCAATSVGAAARPNVLFLFSDDQRADAIHALGNPHVQTPNLDRLAQNGLVFTRAYCMGAMQGAVCVPSRAMLMSGRTLFHIKENLGGLTTWPEVFAAAGYTTMGIGKWHNQPASFIRAFQRGRSVFFGGMADPFKMPVQDLRSDRTMSEKRTGGKHASEMFADAAVEFLREQKDGKPFALYVAFTAPHDPRLAPKAFHDRYDAAKLPLPKNYLPQHPFNNGELTVRDEHLAPWPRTPEIVRAHLADYYASVTFLDAQVGRILDALKASGQSGNTIIVFASDHGLALGSHGLFGKQNLYEHSMRPPLILAGPGIPRGGKSDALCYLLDLFPTLCDLAGLKAPASVEGLSLAPVIAGTKTAGRDSIFTAYRNVQRAVRDDRWKLIVYPQINKSQLFDLTGDPDELLDLVTSAEHAGEVKRLTALLGGWQQKLGDTLPLTTDPPQPAEFDFSKVKSGREEAESSKFQTPSTKY